MAASYCEHRGRRIDVYCSLSTVNEAIEISSKAISLGNQGKRTVYGFPKGALERRKYTFGAGWKHFGVHHGGILAAWGHPGHRNFFTSGRIFDSHGQPRPAPVSRAAPAGPGEASQVGSGPAKPTLPALAGPSFPLHFLCIPFVFPLYMQCLPKMDPYFSVLIALLVPEPWLKVTGGPRRTSVLTRRRPARGLWMVG